jgi:hypothetical protein
MSFCKCRLLLAACLMFCCVSSAPAGESVRPPPWSFTAPRPPAPPALGGDAGAINPIDNFIRARLAAEHLEPSPPADKTTLLRRVTFDLTGLPPTLAEVDAFLADTSPQAYEKVVDRLLASPRFGERMAVNWLDAARYADTNGYQSDEQRQMWRWRDWVINAFNRNLPFDQFTIEQLAGDLLPSPTLDQLIATGFNRNHRANSEGGIIPEEFLVEYAVDRLDTTATVWLGLTIGCARCHDHKFDPVSQKDFYRMLAFFNNVPEQGKVTRIGNAPPIMKAPTPEIAAEIRRLDDAVASAQQEWKALAAPLDAAQAQWESTLKSDADQSVSENLVVHYELNGNTHSARLPGDDKAPECKFVGGTPAYAAGKRGLAADFHGDRYVETGLIAVSETDPFSYGAWIYPTSNGPMAILSAMDERNSYMGYDVFIDNGKVQADVVARILDDALRVETNEPIALNTWHHVLFTYDGSRKTKGMRIYVDGTLQKLKVIAETLGNVIKPAILRIGSRGTGSLFHGRISDVRFFSRALNSEEAATLAVAESSGQIVKIPTTQRSMTQTKKLRSHFLRHDAPRRFRAALARLDKARQARLEVEKTIPTTMVMQEKPMRGDTFILIRGQYDKPGEKVQPGVPASLPPLPKNATPNRLALARWLVDPANPLTARVTVNRYWQMYFGMGLVKTAEDFGSQGEVPRQQDLLDWLAADFIGSGWDVKAMQKTIVMSATYRQSSKLSPTLLARDPDNRLLARGPRYRLPAEMVRDQALVAGGLLVEKVGGPSVKPYQPPGLWEELGATAGAYPQDHGQGLYRRSLYTFWKRTIPPPGMMIFDAAGRDMCSVRQVRTNTPLQALMLLNDIPYVEASRGLAQRVLLSDCRDAESRVGLAFRLATGRAPKARELSILVGSVERYVSEYRQHPQDAAKLLAVGESPRTEKLDSAELAAFTVVASVILNLDETMTKE